MSTTHRNSSRSIPSEAARTGSLKQRHAARGLALAVAAISLPLAARSSLATDAVTFNGTAYTQNFDTLPDNTDYSDITMNNAPVVAGTTYTLPAAGTSYDLSTALSSSQITTMAGWYAVGPGKNVYGANGGSTTTGGILSYGAAGSSDRALGILSTSTTGLGEVGVLLYNNTSTTFNNINLTYNAELWRQGGAKSLNFGYVVQSAGSLTSLPTSSTSGYTSVAALGSGTFTAGTGGSTDNSAPVAVNSVNATDAGITISNWAPGSYIWLTWTMNATTGSSQGIGIDDLSFNATNSALPGTPTWNVNSGTWDTSTGNWTGGSPNPNQYKDGDNATFGSITADSLITVTSGGVSPGSTTISNNTHTYTFQGGAIGGNGSLTMSGTSTAILTATNTYLGGTFLNAGTLIVQGGDDRLGNSAGGITFAGGTLQTNSVGLTTARAIVVNTGGGTFNTNGLSSSSSASVSVNAPFTILGGGNLTLSGSVTMGTSGSVNIGNPTATTLDATTLTLSQSSGTVDFGNNGGTINGNIVVTGGVRVNFSQGVFATTVTSGTRPEIQIQATDVMVNDPVNGPSLSSGPFISNLSTLSTGGTVDINIHLNSLTTSAANFTRSDVTGVPIIAGGPGFLFPSSNGFVATIGGTKGPPNGGGSTLHSANIVINGVIYGYADLNISNSPKSGGGSGNVTLNAQNQYTGVTMDNSNQSTLYLGIDNALPVGTDLIFGTFAGFGAPTLDLNGHNQTVNSLSWGGVGSPDLVTITNNGTANSVLTIGSPTSTTTAGADFGGLITDGIGQGTGTGSLALVKNGSGTFVMSGVYTFAMANTYTGGTTIKGGVLQIPNDAALGAVSGALTFDGGALTYADPADSVSNVVTSTDRQLVVTANGGTINTSYVDPSDNTDIANVTFSGNGGYQWGSTASHPLTINGTTGSSVTIDGGSGTVSVTPGATIHVSSNGTLIAGGSSDPFTDSSDSTKHVSIQNDGAFSVSTGSKVIGALSGAGNTTVSSGASLTATQITQNTLTVNGMAAIAQSITPNSNTSVVSSLVIGGTTNAWTGTLDIGNNSLVISNGGSGVTGQNVTRQVTNQVQSGLNINGTLWTGTGIISSAAAADASLTHGVGVIQNNSAGATVGDGTTTDATPGNQIYSTFEGQAVNLNDTLVKYTWFGDADLSGTIDSTDYFLIDNGFANGLSGWINGDFDYSGTIDSTDYFLIDNAFANQSGPLSAAFVLSQPFGAQNYQALLALGEIAGTPEPTSLALLGLGAVGLLARRKRRTARIA